MRSEMRDHVPGRPLTRLTDRFGAVLLASTTVLAAEVAIAAIACWVWAPSISWTPMTFVLLVLVVPPVVAVLGAALGALLSVVVVMPLLVTAGWLGREVSGREVWWWILVLAAATSTLPAVVAAASMEAGPTGVLLAGLGGWIASTAALTIPALVARRLLLPDRPHLSGGAMFGWLCLHGTLAVGTVGTLALLAVLAGVG
ncbi:hypothetical protein ABZX98_01520 [Streptomyces sp. NPDC002992]|uniref:hypothetical protein n=1 Tax=Streptomyces sp. NPDC002992 TaxID=3154273 RepID=UPI0033B7D72E